MKVRVRMRVSDEGMRGNWVREEESERRGCDKEK